MNWQLFKKRVLSDIRCHIAIVLLLLGANASLAVSRFQASLSTLAVKPKMIAQLENVAPCLTSLIGPPSKGCLKWQANVNASATFDDARRIFFAGGADDYIHVIDGDSGYRIADVKVKGRAVTDIRFDRDGSVFYAGTDKGMLYRFNAYTFAVNFSVEVDSKVNNNLTFIGDDLIFTSALGTVYCLDKNNGKIKWRLLRPMAKERLRLESQSNILSYQDPLADSNVQVIVPHADGYISFIDVKSGKVLNKLVLEAPGAKGMPDVVSPMVMLNNKLWVASFGRGVFAIDRSIGRIRDRLPILNIVQMSFEGSTLFAASPDKLYAISEQGRIMWENDFSKIRSRLPRSAFPFDGFAHGAKRMFFGTPSRLLVSKTHILMANSSIGFFDKSTGRLDAIIGNSVGFGPKISWAEPGNLVAVSKRGLLMKFQVTNPIQGHLLAFDDLLTLKR